MGEAIGVLDSGLGGLTVLKALQARISVQKIIYIADHAFAPYGEKESKAICTRTQLLMDHLVFDKKVSFIVNACHTSSAALNVLPSDFFQKGCPKMTMIAPTVAHIQRQEFSKGLAIMATVRSVKERVLERALRQSGFSLPIQMMACPEMVPLIEDHDWAGLRSIMTHYLSLFDWDKVDHVLHGCTHYPLGVAGIGTISRHSFLNPSQAVAQFVQEKWGLNRLDLQKKPDVRIFFTVSKKESPYMLYAEKLEKTLKFLDIHYSSIQPIMI